MPTRESPLYYITSFAYPSADRCMCYRHNGNRCNVLNCSVELTRTDPDRSQTPRLYCLDCWIACRDETTTENPSQTRLYEEQKRNGFTLMAIGC